MKYNLPHFLLRKQIAKRYRSASNPSIEYRVIFQSVLIGSFILVAVTTFLLSVSYFIWGNSYVAPRAILCGLGLLYLVTVYIAWTHSRQRLASLMLIGFYFFLSAIVMFAGGVSVPFGLLMLAICIVLSGILMGSKGALYAASVSIFLLMFAQSATSIGFLSFLNVQKTDSGFGDAIAYSTLLGILGLISWLFGRRNEYLFSQQRAAEAALIKEKELLEIRVEERTRQLQKAQLDELEQLHQFAEIGQLSAALLHDLANHLSVLNFDLADLKKIQHGGAIRRAEESISYLEQAVDQVRKQLHGNYSPNEFDAIEYVTSNIQMITPKATAANVSLSLESPAKPVMLHGDPLRLGHVINILVQNGIEAYEKVTSRSKRIVKVTIRQTKTDVIIRVRDNGIGISRQHVEQLFASPHTTKKHGLGVGLFIAKKIIEVHFRGNLDLSTKDGHTDFIITIPKKTV